MAETSTTYSIRKFFAGKNIFLTGSTGFLAKAVLEKILHDLPEAGRVFLLIRPRARPDGSLVDPRQRVSDEILRNSAFSRLRERHGEKFEAYCQERIVCVPGDLTLPNLGLDDAALDDLAKGIQVIIHSAATVVFDERLDLALQINTLSPGRLLALARRARAPLVHVSTAYVSGTRRGLIAERVEEPLVAIDQQLAPDAPRPQSFDVRQEVARLEELCRSVKAEAEAQIARNGWAEDSEEARGALRRALVGAGMTRARSLGWNDTYTYTKFLGEHLLKLDHGEVPAVIVRSSIIESSLRDPEPGWLDGLRMADPLIVGFGKGRLDDFPADPQMTLDIIPADMVVNAILAAAAHNSDRPGAFDVVHVASSSENPLIFEHLYSSVRDYFQKNPMLDRAGRPVRVPKWKFPSVDRFRGRIKNRYLRPMKLVSAVIDGPIAVPGTRKLRTRLRLLNTTLEQLLYYVDIYSPYTNLKCRFDTQRARAINEAMDPEEREVFGYDPKQIHWRHYLQDVHIPGLKRNILRMDEPPRAGAGEGKLLDEETAQVRRRATTVRGVPRTIVDLAARGADLHHDRVFLEMVREGRSVRLTFRELYEGAGRLACKLRAKLGLHTGDRVVLWGENAPEWPLAYLSIVRAACTAVPLDRQMPLDEALRIAEFTGAKAIVISPALLERHREGLAGNALPLLNPYRELEPHGGYAWPVDSANVEAECRWEPAPEALASILFTSGTTLSPKGVMLTHANLISDALAVAEILVPHDTDRFMSVLPLHHAFEFTGGFLVPLFGGASIHYLETLRPQELSETMKRAGITVVLAVPRLFQVFADNIRQRVKAAGIGAQLTVNLADSMAGAAELFGNERARKKLFAKVHQAFGGKIRLFVSGGAELNPDLVRFFGRFAIPLVEGYGLTETGPVVTVNPLAAPRPGSVGIPLPGVEIRLHQPDVQGIGEILVRGPNVMQGYWKDPEATEKTFEQGWFRTGDLGRFDGDGYLYVTGRVKDVIVTAAGKKVFPIEIEWRLRDVPGLRECCVLGLPARQSHGEEVAVVAVPEPGTDREKLRAAIERVNQDLPSHQQIARIEFMEGDLPKTTTLKVQRGKLRAQLTGGATIKPGDTGPAARAARSDDEVLTEVAKAIAETANVSAGEVAREQRLQLDLGLDSIGRLDLVGKLELRLSVSLPDDALARMRTVGDLVDLVHAVRGKSRKSERRAGLQDRVWKSGEFKTSGVLKPSLPQSLLRGVMQTTEKVFFNTYLSIEAHGLEHIPASGSFVMASNHSSHLDTAAVRAVLGRRAGDFHVMGAKDYFFDTRLKSWFFSTVFSALPFEREEHTLEGLGLCREVLQNGKALLIFPEGGRTVTGKLRPFKPGIGILAVELEVPVLPVFVGGTFESLPKGRTVPRPSRVVVRFGAPLDFSQLKARRQQEGEGSGGERRRRGGLNSELYRTAAEMLRAEVERLSQMGADLP